MYRKSFLISFSLFLVSCTHTEGESNSQIFNAPRHKVWEALVAVLKSYPLKTIDEQKGYIETKVLQANHFWKPPHLKDFDFSGYSSVILVSLEYNKPIARVFIDKKVYKQKGFMSPKKEVPFNSLEENILLYQVARELAIRSKLDRIR